MSKLNDKDKYDSYNAVKQFLIDGKRFHKGGNIPCYFIEGTRQTESEISVELISAVPSYNLNDDIFLSYNLRNPIWSAYKLLKWNNETKELIIEVNKHKTIKLKRIVK